MATKGTIETAVDAFNTYIDADNYSAAKKELAKIGVTLATRPDNERLRWRSTLKDAMQILEELRLADGGWKSLLWRRG